MLDTKPLLEVRDLNVWFTTDDGNGAQTETHVLRGINFSLRAGERLGLVGESGCGKTTTILAAMGLLPSSASVSGEVLIDGVDILRGGERTMVPHRWTDVAMVFQGAMNSLNPVHTIGWQIEEALRQHQSVPRTDVDRRVGELLELVGIPAERRKSYPHEFSGGMRQRAVIAMALACQPRVLLADEPTTALDVVVQRRILTLLNDLCDRLGLALVMVTHDLGVVAESCDRAAVMLGGEIIEEAAVQDLHDRPVNDYTQTLFSSTPSLYGDSKAPIREAQPVLLEVRDLTVDFDRPRSRRSHRRGSLPTPHAVDNLSFDVERGELVALVGQSGCGKTTTAQSILGMVPEARGEILLSGQSVISQKRRGLKVMRRRIQMIYQDPYESLDSRMRVRSILTEPLMIHGFGSARERRKRVQESLERVGLTPPETYLDRYPHELSGGQRQRVSIASCLVLEPELLLADEPVSMLDVSLRIGVLDLLNSLRADGSLGVVMITHDLSTAAIYADRILVMNAGRLVEQGPTGKIVNDPQDSYTRILLASVPDPDPGHHVQAVV